jgi:hypothetical protein
VEAYNELTKKVAAIVPAIDKTKRSRRVFIAPDSKP